jgi:transcriptional regulator with XRE-family HTH domain
MGDQSCDPVMEKVRALAGSSGLSLDDLGERMGYQSGKARRSVWQFLHRTNDPRLSMLRRFARAVGVSLRDLVE